MKCYACPEEIDDSNYVYLPYKDDNGESIMKPVHAYHLRGNRTTTNITKEGTINNEVTPTSTDQDIIGA